MHKQIVGVLGATSLVGDCLLPLLRERSYEVIAFSRSAANGAQGPQINWVKLDGTGSLKHHGGTVVENWVSLVPVWVLPYYLGFLEDHGARRVVALSSTSRFTKGTSSDSAEQELARCIADSEERLSAWADNHSVGWVILRPTLIYGLGRDKNVCEIARFIRRFGFFPLLGRGDGMRQPIHARDVASACFSALVSPISRRAYDISGADKMPYRGMVTRIFEAEQVPPRFVSVPRALFRLCISVLRPLPRFRTWSVGMAERMNRDLSFSHAEAARDLGFLPSGFRLERSDLPP